VDPLDEITITVTPSELHLLIEGLDAYEYWQLGDVLPRNNGEVFLPDDPSGDRYWAPNEEPTEAQQEAIEGVRRCRELTAQLDEARRAGTDAGDVGARFERARGAHGNAVAALVPALIARAVAKVAEVLPGTTSLEVLGETNEDGLDILRIQRVRNAAGDVLYNVDVGHPDRAVEDRIDHVGSEYLDQLLDITYGQYFGRHVLAAPDVEH
jgi:hypothetical protein